MSRTMTENGGYFVCRTRHVVLAGGSSVRAFFYLPIHVFANKYMYIFMYIYSVYLISEIQTIK